MKQTRRLRSDQNGFASIVIALVLIIVLSLLTIGFAQLARREQQNALNKQLADQAYYAAESGVNDAYQDVQTWATNGTNPSSSDCLGTGANASINLSAPASLSSVGSGVSLTCVLVNMRPPDIVWSNVNADTDRSVTFSTVDDSSGNPGAINSLTIAWASADGRTTPRPAANTDLLPAPVWAAGKYPPVLEVSITPLGASFDRSALINNTFTVFLYPSRGGGSVDYDTSKQGQIIAAADCSNPGAYPCSVVINKLSPAGGGNTSFLVHIISHYDTANIDINNARAGNGGTGAHRDFADGVAQIDVTARAQNVLKRLHVTVPLKASADLPPGPIEGQGVCKREAVYPASGPYDPYGPNNPYGASDSACLVP